MEQPCNCDQSLRLIQLLGRLADALSVLGACTNSMPPGWAELIAEARAEINKGKEE